jgi:hypothetical protein
MAAATRGGRDPHAVTSRLKGRAGRKSADDKREAAIIYSLIGLLGLLSATSYLALLPTAAEFVMHALSIFFIGLMLYRAKLSWVLFGEERTNVTLAIIGVSMLMSVKTILVTLINTTPGGFIQLLLEATQASIGDVGLYALSALLFVVLSVWLSGLRVKSPSVLDMLGEEGVVTGAKRIVRAAVIFVTLVAFHVLIFDITLQWWSLIIGTAFIIIAMGLLVLNIVQHEHYNISFKRFLLIIENFEHFIYGHFSALFHKRSTLLFGIAALLVLYPLSDLAAYVIPYVTNIMNSGYSDLFSLPNHLPLAPLAYRAFAAGRDVGILASLVYGLNAIAIFLGLCLPALFWYRMFRKRTLTLSPIASGVALTAAACAVLAPAFELGRLSLAGLPLVGVDIMTQEVPASGLLLVLALSAAVGMVTYLAAKRYPTQASFVVIALTLAFFGRYMLIYFADVWSELIGAAILFLQQGNLIGFIAGFMFIAFLALSTLFYIGALAVYVYEIWVSLWHEHHESERAYHHATFTPVKRVIEKL